MSDLITSNELADLAAVRRVPLPTQIVANNNKFIVRVTVNKQVRTVGAIQKGNIINERKFVSLSAVGTFLHRANIHSYQVNMTEYQPTTRKTRIVSNQKRMQEVHKLAKHTAWLRKEVEASRADPRPGVSHEEAGKIFDAHLQSLREEFAGKSIAKKASGKKATA